MKRRNWPWVPFALLAIVIGLYPLTYYLLDMKSHGILQSKSTEILNYPFYIFSYYCRWNCPVDGMDPIQRKIKTQKYQVAPHGRKSVYASGAAEKSGGRV